MKKKFFVNLLAVVTSKGKDRIKSDGLSFGTALDERASQLTKAQVGRWPEGWTGHFDRIGVHWD